MDRRKFLSGIGVAGATGLVATSQVQAQLLSGESAEVYDSLTGLSGIKYFATVAEMQADTALSVGGAIIIGERDNSLWQVIATTTNNGYDILDGTASSVSVQLRIGDIVHVRAFGVNGETSLPGDVDQEEDYTEALKRVFTVSGGKIILFDKARYYQSRDTLAMQDNTTINLNGAFLRFNIVGQKRCLVTSDGCTVKNGVVQNVTKDNMVYGAEWQQPVCIGFSNAIIGVSNVLVENLTVTSTSPEGNAIFVFGESKNIIIQNIDIPDNSNFGEPIGAHWGVEPGGDETQGTGHPDNIIFKNIRIGSMSYKGAAACYLSAVGSVILENIYVEDYQNGQAIYIFAGDHGFQYATDPNLKDLGTRLSINNVYGKALSGIFVYMRDTHEGKIVWPSKITIDNCNLQSRSQTSSSSKGLRVGGTDGLTFRNSILHSFYHSIFLDSKVTNLHIENNNIINSFKDAVDADNSLNCSKLKFSGNNFIHSKYSQSGTHFDIRIGSYISDVKIEGNNFNSPSVTHNVYCSQSQPPSNVKVINNYVENAGGTFFVFGSSTSSGICSLFTGNTHNKTVNHNIRGGQEYVPYARTAYKNSKLEINYYVGAGTPSYGTYNQGDIIYDNTPSAGGKIGSVCVTSGTPGTWKAFGVIDA